MKKRATSPTRTRTSSEGRRTARGADSVNTTQQVPGSVLQRAREAGTGRDLDPTPTDLMDRLSIIPLLFESKSAQRSLSAKMTDDSWSTVAPVGLRDIVDGHLRRIAFTSGPYEFELVAERRSYRWEFVGRVYHRGRTLHNMVLILGRRRLLPGAGGFFQWSSPHVVRRMSLSGASKRIVLENIVW